MPAYITDSGIISEMRTINSRLAKLEQMGRTGASQTTDSGLSGTTGDGATVEGLTEAEADALYLRHSGGTMYGVLTLNSGFEAVSGHFSGNLVVDGTLTAGGEGFALDSMVVHLAGAETITGTKTFTVEQRFYAGGAYVDPDLGTTRAIKIGFGGLAVKDGLKTDTLTALSGTFTNGGILTDTLEVQTQIVATGGIDFGANAIIDLSKSANADLGTIGTGVGDKVALYSNTYGFGIQAGRLVAFAPATAGFAVRSVNTGTGHQSAGPDAHTFLSTGDATHTGTLTVGTGFTLSAGTATLPVNSLAGAALTFDSVTGVGTSAGTGIGHLAMSTVGSDNLANNAVTSDKLAGGAVASRNLATGTIRDTDSTMFRTATAATTDETGQAVGGLNPGLGMTRSSDGAAFDGVAIFSGTAAPGSVTTGPAYDGLKPGTYKATFVLWSPTALNNDPLLTLNATGAGITATPVTVTSAQLNSSERYVSYSIGFTVSTDVNSLDTTVMHNGGSWRWSHVYVEPHIGPVDNEIQTQYIRDLAVTNAKIKDLSVSKLIAGSIESDDIYLGTGGHIYAGAKQGGRVELNSGGIFAYTTQNLVPNANHTSFEDGTTVWTFSANNTRSNTGAQAFHGTRSMAVVVTTLATETTTSPVDKGTGGIAIEPNTDYTASLYVKGAQQRAVRLRALLYKADGTAASVPIEQTSALTISTIAWTRLILTFTSPPDAEYLTPEFYVGALDAINGETYYVDALQVETGTAATAFTTYLDPISTNFALRNNGTLTLKGEIISGSTITGTTLTGTIGLVAGSGNAVFKAGAPGIHLGHTAWASAPFRVNMAGSMWATNATISGNISASTMETSTITASNTIYGQAILAGTIDVDRLNVSVLSFRQAIENPEFDVQGALATDAANWTPNYEITGTISTSAREADADAGAGQWMYTISPTANSGSAVASDGISVKPGEAYDIRAMVKAQSALGPIYVRALFGTTPDFSRGNHVAATPKVTYSTYPNGSGTGYGDVVQAYRLPALNTWYTVGGYIEVPEGASYMRIAVYAWSNANAWTLNTRSVTATQKVGGTQIANGVVTTEMVVAQGIKADAIAAGTLRSTAYIVVGSLAAGQRHMIFDGRTGSRGIRFFNGSETVVNMDPETGNSYFKGEIRATSGSFYGSVTATDGTFTGTVYANNGTFTGTVNANAGNFTGNITSTAVITGGTVVASSVRSTNAPGTANSWALQSDFAYRVWGPGAARNVYIDMNGYAEFSNAKVTGNIVATNGTFSGSISSTATISGGHIIGAVVATGVTGQKRVVISPTGFFEFRGPNSVGSDVQFANLNAGVGFVQINTGNGAISLGSGNDYWWVQDNLFFEAKLGYMTLNSGSNLNLEAGTNLSLKSFNGTARLESANSFVALTSNDERMFFDTIETSNSNIRGSYLQQQGWDTFSHYNYSYGYYARSSQSLKTDIEPVTTSLLSPMQAIPVKEFTYNVNLNKRQVGFVAEDVLAMFPELVVIAKDGTLAIDQVGLTAYLFKAVQELAAKQDKVENTVTAAVLMHAPASLTATDS